MSSTLLALAAVVAQHCGGPCEVPRGADPVSADPKYALTAGKERADWRYLWNWVWTEDGVEKHRLEQVFRAPPLCGFGYRRVFVSPAGNGFLVTGNPYAGKYQTCREAPLFRWSDCRSAARLVQTPRDRSRC